MFRASGKARMEFVSRLMSRAPACRVSLVACLSSHTETRRVLHVNAERGWREVERTLAATGKKGVRGLDSWHQQTRFVKEM